MVWPFTRPAAAPETKSLANPSPELLALFSGAGIGSISEGEALSVPAVSSAIRLISEAVATLSVCVKQKVGDSETDAPDHPAHVLLNGQVNTWLSSYEFLRDITASALIGDAGGMALVTKVRKSPREIIPYNRGIISADYDPITGEPSYRNAGQAIDGANVIHLRAPFGRAPLTLAREAIGLAKAMESYAGALFKNGARPGGVLTSDKTLSGEALERLRTVWSSSFGGADKAGKTPVLVDGVKFTPMAMTSTDSQFLENRKFQTIEIARAFRVPPSMLFELDRATWSNSEQQGKEFLSYSLAPWLRALEAALNRALLTPDERRTYRIAFDEDDLTRADLSARATAYSSLIASRIINPNQARAWEGLADYDGGEEYMNPAIAMPQPGGKPPPESRNDNRPA